MSGDTLKTTTEAYWGKLRKLPSVDAIFRACEELEQENRPVNRDTVKARSGVTFNNLLADGLELYRRRESELAEFTHTPTSLLHIIAQVVDREFAALHTNSERQQASWDADIASLTEGLKLDLEQQKARCSTLKSDLQEKHAQMEALIESQHELQSELRAMEKALVERENHYHAALGEGEELRQALTVEQQSQLALTRDHQAQLAALKDEQRQQRQELIAQHDKETARLQAQLGNERGDWKQERANLEKALHMAREEGATLKAELQERRGEASQQRQLLAERDQWITDLKQQLQSAVGLTATIEQQARQIRQQENEIVRLREQTETEANDRITQLLDRISNLQQVKENNGK